MNNTHYIGTVAEVDAEAAKNGEAQGSEWLCRWPDGIGLTTESEHL